MTSEKLAERQDPGERERKPFPVAIQRLLDEVAADVDPGRVAAYDRQHNRHNRS